MPPAGFIRIDDPDDERLREYRDLTDADLRRERERDDGSGHGLFIAEGALVVRQLLASGLGVRSVVVTPTRFEAMADVLEPSPAPVFLVDQPVLNAVGGFNIHRGVLAAADRPGPRDWREVSRDARRVAVLEDVNDQENLGALFRNAAGLGMDGLLLSPRCGDPFYRRTVRVSMGHVLRVPFARLEPWPAALDELAGARRLIALSPTGSVNLADLDVGRADRLALALGAEGPGLSDHVLSRAAVSVRIPMAPGVDSLNVAAASAIAFAHLGSPHA